MKNRLERYYPYIPFVLFGIYSLMVHKNVDLVGDDIFYKHLLDNQTISEWLDEQFLSWGGRFALILLEYCALQLPLIVWKVINSVVFLLQAVSISQFIKSDCKNEKLTADNNFVINLSVCFMLASIPRGVLMSSVLWISGAFTYLWTTVSLFFALLIFVRMVNGEKIGKIKYIIGLLTVILACSAEQTGAIFVCICIAIFVCSLIKKNKIDVPIFCLFALGCIVLANNFIGPGVGNRFDAEMFGSFPSYDMLGMMDRAVLGLVNFFLSVFDNNNLFFAVLLMLMLILYMKKDKWSKLFCAFTLFITILLKYFEWKLGNSSTVDILDFTLIIFLMVLWILLVTCMVFHSFSSPFSGMLAGLLFLASIISGVIVGFSPSVYSSGERVFYISYAVLTCVIGMIMKEIVNEAES